MEWWKDNRLRLVQNNLREIDARADIDHLLRELKKMHANVWMINAGGIYAFYPSHLKHQYRSSYLQDDFLGEAIAKAHAEGLKVIVRFDFSKTHASLFDEHPQWYYRDRNGEPVNYYGIMHTCLNGEYQQSKSLETIEEVLERYPADGIFFNMFGYQHWDYSGRYYGPCYCENCKRRFHEITGASLEDYDGSDSPLHDAYQKFQEETSQEILERIHQRVKARWPHVAISTYHPHYVDIVRKESNTAFDRPLPHWIYSASENVASTTQSWEGKGVSNCSINALDLTYRFVGVSEEETAIRLYQNIANGSGLDFCIIGAFEDYPDRTGLEMVGHIFAYHAKHEQYYGDLKSLAQVVLIKPQSGKAREEYKGWYKILKQSHYIFDVVEEQCLVSQLSKLQAAQVIILPGSSTLAEETALALEEARQGGTALVSAGGMLDADLLARWFHTAYSMEQETRYAAYLDVSNKQHFPSLPKRDWLAAVGSTARMLPDPQRTSARMMLIEPALFGPPERAYGHQLGCHPGLTLTLPTTTGVGIGAFFAFGIGESYSRYGREEYRLAASDLLQELVGERRLVTHAPPTVEVFFNALPNGDRLLQLLNLSGFDGSSYHQPYPLYALELEWQEHAAKQLAADEAMLAQFRDQTLVLQGEGEDEGEVTIEIESTDTGLRLRVRCLVRYSAIVLPLASMNGSE